LRPSVYEEAAPSATRDAPVVIHEWHDLALGPPLPAEAAGEAQAQRGEPGFWAMHDKIFLDRSACTRDKLEGYALALGLDMDLFAKALDRSTHLAAGMHADSAAAMTIGVLRGPAFVIALRGASTGCALGFEVTVADRVTAD
jgi:predicted DsbA family dithiol-disulfide isomerase